MKLLSSVSPLFLKSPSWAVAVLMLVLPGFAGQVWAGEWEILFDGASLDGWQGYHSAEVPEGWRVDDGALHFSDGKGDIVSSGQYGNFVLELEWKVSECGNSGIFYLAAPSNNVIYEIAPEMQVLDDACHKNGKDPLTSAGAAYGLYPAPRGIVKPAGEWNAVKLVHRDGEVEHWLNGQKIIRYELGSEDWKNRVANSKFSKWQDYGTARKGHIGLQDHGDPVWFRNIRVKVLD